MLSILSLIFSATLYAEIESPFQIFSKIDSAIKSNDYQAIEAEAVKLKESRLFEEYSNLYLAQSTLLAAKEEYRKSNYESAIQKAKDARWKFSEIMVLEPYFSLEERIKKFVFDSELLLGESNLKVKNSTLAIKYFENAFNRIPSSQLMIHVPMQSLRSYISACKSFSGKTCESWLVVFFDKYPSKSLEYSELKKAFPEIEKQALEKTEKKTVQSYRDEDKDDKLFNEAFALYLSRDYRDSGEFFEKFLKEYPQSKHLSRVQYWLAQIYKKRNKTKNYKELLLKLIKDFPLTYYGLLAAFDLGKSIDEAISAELPVLKTKAFGLKKGEQESLSRIEYFIKNKLFSQAGAELNTFQINSRMPKDFLMYLADISFKSKAYLASFRFLNEYFQREGDRPFSTRHVSLIFPEVYLEKITPIAQKYKVDPLLVLSLIKQESGFQDEAISHAGAVGLMQLMPFTAIAVQPKVYQSNVNDIQKNLELGIEHFANEIKMAKGNIPVALAAYNAGAGRARGWWSDSQKTKSNIPEFIEQISYSETRGYVSSILRNYYWYTKRINNKKITDFEYLVAGQ